SNATRCSRSWPSSSGREEGRVSALLFLHEVGDAGGAARWRALGAGWLVPDLPGHGVVPPEEGAYYAPGDVALVGVRALAAAGLDGEPPLVAGHGWGAFGAELRAAATRASRRSPRRRLRPCSRP